MRQVTHRICLQHNDKALIGSILWLYFPRELHKCLLILFNSFSQDYPIDQFHKTIRAKTAFKDLKSALLLTWPCMSQLVLAFNDDFIKRNQYSDRVPNSDSLSILLEKIEFWNIIRNSWEIEIFFLHVVIPFFNMPVALNSLRSFSFRAVSLPSRKTPKISTKSEN